MAGQSTEIVRKPRADAVRNRERVLEAAKTVFSAGGSEASLEAVARHAGVGIGTLYRHFPTREALYEAVYRREVEQLGDLAEQLEDAPETVDALRRWLHANVEFVATKKGMVAALALVAYGPAELQAYSFDRLTRAIGALLKRAVAAGEQQRCTGGKSKACQEEPQPNDINKSMRADIFVQANSAAGSGSFAQAAIRRQAEPAMQPTPEAVT